MAEQLITQVSQSQARSFNQKKKTDVKLPIKKPGISLSLAPAQPQPDSEENSERAQYGINSPRGGPDAASEDNSKAAANNPAVVKGVSTHPPSNDSEENNNTAAKTTTTVASTVSDHQIHQQPVEEPTPPPEEPEPVLTAPWTTNELLPPLIGRRKGKKCLILDLDETLVHSSFHSVDCDFEIPVDIEGIVRTIYVAKRPHVDEFMKVCGELFEVVVFTASLAKYADPLLDLLDIHRVIDHRLFRESCTQHNGTFVKDLFRIGRPLNQIIIIDNSPHSYAFNPQNAIPCESWFDDKNDSELLVILEILKRIADPTVEDVIKEMEALEVSASCSSLGYPYESEIVPLQDAVNESASEDEEVSLTAGETESDGGDASEETDGQWKVT